MFNLFNHSVVILEPERVLLYDILSWFYNDRLGAQHRVLTKTDGTSQLINHPTSFAFTTIDFLIYIFVLDLGHGIANHVNLR